MNKFVISDLHLGHDKILEFVNLSTGETLRPWNTLDEMHEALLDRWNSVVSDKDIVYILGDVSFNFDAAKSFFSKAKGIKELILGNHDQIFPNGDGKPRLDLSWFRRVDGARFLDIVIDNIPMPVCLSHIPVNENILDGKRAAFNLHGHLHSGVVKCEQERIIRRGHPTGISFVVTDDLRYINTCVEAIDYTPAKLDVLVKERFDRIEKDMRTVSENLVGK